MIPIQAVTLVSAGGTPAQLCDQRGAPWPTTGHGALVFSTGAFLTDAQLLNPKVVGIIEGVAPIDSPIFTGDPQVPTPPLNDDDSSIPNTSWVNDAIAAALATDVPDWSEITNKPATFPPTIPAGPAISAWPFLPLAGGTLTGAVTGTALTLSGDLTLSGAVRGVATLPIAVPAGQAIQLTYGGAVGWHFTQTDLLPNPTNVVRLGSSGNTFAEAWVTTPAPGTNNTRVATTAFVGAAITAATTGGPFLPIAGGTLTGALTISTNNGNPLTASGTLAGAANVLLISNNSTAAGSSSIFQQQVGTKFVNRVVHADGYLHEVGAGGIVSRYSDFDTQIWRINAGTAALTLTGGILAFVNSPTAPTPTPATVSNNQVANTAFVQAAITAAGGGGSGYLPLTGGTLSGTLTARDIVPSGATYQLGAQANPWLATWAMGASITNAAGLNRSFIFQSAALNRWTLRANATAESGSNAGSDFEIVRFNDAGTSLGNALSINRATGVADFAVAPTIAGVPIGGGSYLPLAGGTLTGKLTINMATADAHALLLADTTYGKAVRFSGSATGYAIEGVDSTGNVSYQPLRLAGSTVTLAAAGLSGMRLDTGMAIGVGGAAVPATTLAGLHMLGAGQATATPSTSTGTSGTLYLQDSGTLVNNGGMLQFGAGQGAFAAIKGLINNGSPNTTGDLSFSTRRAIADTTLTEAFRIGGTTGIVNFAVAPTVAGVPIGGGGASITVSVTPPGSPTPGALWFQSELAQLFVYYNDGNTSQWVPASAPASASTPSSNIPPGGVIDFAGGTIPDGWLACLGQSVTTAAYPALFAAIQYIYGGSGPNFNVPDYGGRVIAGKEATATRLTAGASGIDGATLGAVGGNQNMQSHQHGMNPGTNITGYGVVSPDSGAGYSFSGPKSTDLTGAGASQNVQPTAIANKIIKV